MHKRERFTLALALSLFALSAVAQTSLTVAPQQVYAFESVESFLTLQGSSLLGGVDTKVVFVGSNGTFQLEPSTATESKLEVWLPSEVAGTPGNYAVSVVATEATGARTIGPVTLSVIERPATDEPEDVGIPEVVVVEATSTDGAFADFQIGGATCSRTGGGLFTRGSTTVNCTVKNRFGGTSSISFSVVVTDTTPPTLTVPADITTDSATVTYSVTASDNLDGPITNTQAPAPYVSCFPASGTVFPAGETEVQCVAVDSHHNPTTATFNVFVSTGQPPLLLLPGSFSAEAEEPGGATVDYTAAAKGGTISCSPASGALFPLGTTAVQCSATNSDGTRQGSFNITVVDTIGPVLVGADDRVVEATGANGASVTYNVTGKDLVDGTLTANCSPASGSAFGFGNTTVNCTATDTRGNLGRDSFVVTVRDTTPPVLSLPGDLTREATGPSGAAVSFTATANDVVDGNVAVTCTPASGSTFAIATALVQCSAADSRTNRRAGSFSVTVRDTTPPAITVPADITAEATSASGAAVSYTVSATDLVDGNRPVTCSKASGSTFPLGTTNVQCSASDTRSNGSTASFNVTVRDTTAPTILGIDGTPREVLWPNNHKMTTTTIIVSATDAVDAHPLARVVSVTSDQPVNDNGDGDMAPDWEIKGDLLVDLRSERSSGVDRHYTITVEVTDFSGNKSTGTMIIVVRPGS